MEWHGLVWYDMVCGVREVYSVWCVVRGYESYVFIVGRVMSWMRYGSSGNVRGFKVSLFLLNLRLVMFS